MGYQSIRYTAIEWKFSYQNNHLVGPVLLILLSKTKETTRPVGNVALMAKGLQERKLVSGMAVEK
jgi:hypothetical protein